jgi:hypothetical protein
MKTILLILIIIFTSCNRWCKPENIRSGKSSQHHDSKKFKAMIRVMWAKQFGKMCKVRYQNMKTVIDKVYMNCDCKKVPVGTWVAIDSI